MVLDHLAFGIVGRGRLTELALGFVGLARTEQQSRDLGRLAEADRQQSSRQRIEAAGVAGLGSAEDPPRVLQRRV